MNENLSTGLSRRGFLRIGGYATLANAAAIATLPTEQRPKAVLFDAFPIFDPRSVKQRVESLVPEKAADLHELWKTKIFESQWLRALSGHYADFQQTVQESLSLATRSLGIALTPGAQAELSAAFSNLAAWPDVPAALDALKGIGVTIGFLSNMTEGLLRTNLRNARLEKYFDVVLSTDKVRSFKPDPRAYNLGCTELGLAKNQVLFVSFAAWDTAGAKWFGFPTFWVNRSRAESEFGTLADGEGHELNDLVRFAKMRVDGQSAA